ncbi:unnamed protein product [Coccothraustes coccothraustes]
MHTTVCPKCLYRNDHLDVSQRVLHKSFFNRLFIQTIHRSLHFSEQTSRPPPYPGLAPTAHAHHCARRHRNAHAHQRPAVLAHTPHARRPAPRLWRAHRSSNVDAHYNTALRRAGAHTHHHRTALRRAHAPPHGSNVRAHGALRPRTFSAHAREARRPAPPRSCNAHARP